MKRYSYKTGDKVAYNQAFLKAVQGDKEIADARGVVVSSNTLRPGLSIVKVLWAGEVFEKGCLSSNLCRVTDRILDVTT